MSFNLKQTDCGWIWKLTLTGCLIVAGSIAAPTPPAAAQSIREDATLGEERSTVTRDVEIRGRLSDRIDGGARRGANLFHSFEQFDVNEGRGAYFSNPDGVRNILSRVTGVDRSEIMGTLGVLGNANLFFLNPNGILFGPNASLDLGGSFVGTTADAIGFGEQGFFSARNPEVPSQLLTVDPSAFFFNQIPVNSIANSSITYTSFTTPSEASVVGLRVPDNHSLLLVGGDISMDGGRLNALGGRIELGGISGIGSVGLAINGNTFSLTFPTTSSLSNLTLTNDARVSVRGAGGGNIVVNANILNFTDGGRIVAGTEGAGDAGDVVVNSNEFNIAGVGLNRFGSGLSNQVVGNVSGDAGDIVVNTSSFRALNSGLLVTSTEGAGNAGNVVINANDVNFSGAGDTGFGAGVYSEIRQNASGSAGNIVISANSLSIVDGSISSETYGQGDSGNITINVRDSIEIANGTQENGLNGVSTQVNSGSAGDAGNIFIRAGSLSLTSLANSTNSRSDISTSTSGKGDAGNITIRVDGSISLSQQSYVYSQIGSGAQGNAGDINIDAQTLTLRDGGEIAAAVFRTQGNISGGQGRGGNIRITAPGSISISGVGAGGFSSGIFTNTQRGASGQGGNIEINTGTFHIADGAVVTAQTLNPSNGGNISIDADTFTATEGGQVLTGTFADGEAGDITINVDGRIRLSGSDPNYNSRLAKFGRDVVANSGANSGVLANAERNSTGDGGTITLQGETIDLEDGAEISASTSGTGIAGNISLNLEDTITIDGTNSGIFANTIANSSGNGGNITIDTTKLNLTNGASISAQSQGTGEAGNIRIDADGRFSATDSNIITAAAQSSGGDIEIAANDIRLFGDSDIQTNSGSEGGNITLTASSILAFDDSDIFAFAGERGGDITLNTPAFFGSDYSPDASADNSENLDGNDRVDVNAEGDVESGTITAPDTSLIQNSLTDLPEGAIDPQTLLANSCVVRSQEQQGRFVIVGAGGLPQRPGDAPLPSYATGEVRSVADEAENESRSWQIGDPIVEPQGAYLLEDGQVVLSRECI